ACPSRSNGFLIMAAATSPATPAASPATSGSNRGRRLSKVHRATEWLKPSFARSSATMSASVRDQMPKPSCVSCQLGSPTTTRFTRTRLSDIVHPVSSSQLTQDPDRVRSFGGYNNYRRPTLTRQYDGSCHWPIARGAMRCIACGAELRLMKSELDRITMVPSDERCAFLCDDCDRPSLVGPDSALLPTKPEPVRSARPASLRPDEPVSLPTTLYIGPI